MKKALSLLFFSFLIPCYLQAQKYFPLPDSGAVWTSAKIDTNGIYVENTKFLLSSDTIIKGEIYKKVFSTNDSVIYFPKMKYFAAIREDNNRHWFTIMAKDSLILSLYDFSPKVGDSVYSYHYLPGNGATVILKVLSIDSISINNEFRKRINLKTLFLYKDFYTSWIEGIGSLYQLYLPYMFMSRYDYKLICFEENGILKYHNSPNSDCYYVSINNNQQPKLQHIKSYPNPVTSGQNVYIENLNAGSYHIALLDLMGRNNEEYYSISNGQLIFNADVKKGIYIVKIDGPDNFYGYFKLIVE